MKTLTEYRNTATPHLLPILTEHAAPDTAINFSVLINIIAHPCAATFSDGEEILICHSGNPFPVWVYAKEPCTAETASVIADCLEKYFPLSEGFHYNLTSTLYRTLCDADSRIASSHVKMELISHRLDAINDILHPCDGGVFRPREDEIPYLTRLWHDLSMEMEGFDHPEDFCRDKVCRLMETGSLYVWRNGDGEITALTSRGTYANTYGKVSSVYTLPAYRRRGYAINLVHYVTQTILRDGLVPILYTDGGYAASNACYAKIGYREVGHLCTVKK